MLNGKYRKHNLTFPLVVSSSIWLFQCVSVFSDYNIGCKQSFHLENGIESYFNGWNAIKTTFKESLLSVP